MIRPSLLCVPVVLLALAANAAEVAVGKPQLTLSGTFKGQDPRVSDRDFPVALELKADGGVVGSYGSWIEKRFADKPPQLLVSKTETTGTWTFKDQALRVALAADALMPDSEFGSFNGLAVKLASGPPAEPAYGKGKAPVEKPQLTLSGVFRVKDGRVKDRDFQIALELKGDGSVAGSYESWLEERLVDGTSALSTFKVAVTGTWAVKDGALQVALANDALLPDFKFADLNGLAVRISRVAPDQPKQGGSK